MIVLFAVDNPSGDTTYFDPEKITYIYQDEEKRMRLDCGGYGGDIIFIPNTFRMAHMPGMYAADQALSADIIDLLASLNCITIRR